MCVSKAKCSLRKMLSKTPRPLRGRCKPAPKDLETHEVLQFWSWQKCPLIGDFLLLMEGEMTVTQEG